MQEYTGRNGMQKRNKKNKKKKEIQSYYNYQTYQFSKKEWYQYTFSGLGILVGLSYLFYDSLWFAICLMPGIYFYFQYCKEICKKRRQDELSIQFKEGLLALTASLQAGYVIENAYQEALEGVASLYGKDCYMAQEFSYMLHQMSINKTAEEVMEDLGKRSGIEDIQNFSSVFMIAKRSNGGLGKIMDRTVGTIAEKIEVQREIQTMIQGKRLEQTIMNIVPLGMILYMRISNPGFMDILYSSIAGRLLMTGCLVGYGTAIWMAEKIIKISI